MESGGQVASAESYDSQSSGDWDKRFTPNYGKLKPLLFIYSRIWVLLLFLMKSAIVSVQPIFLLLLALD